MATRGPVWGGESEELNATVLEWPPGEGPGETVAALDVVYAVLAGSIVLAVEGVEEGLHAGEARIVPRDVRRSVVAGPAGARYLTAHRRRGLLHLSPSPR